MLCSDARVLRTTTRTQNFDKNDFSHKGNPIQDFTQQLEMRWTPLDGLLQSDIHAQRSANWPFQAPSKAISTNGAISFPLEVSENADAFWKELVLFDILNEFSGGMRLQDLLVDGGRLGFHVRPGRKNDNSQHAAAYDFFSAEYGTGSVELAKIGARFVVTRIKLSLGPNDRPFVSKDGLDNRLGNYKHYTDFADDGTGLDGLELLYEVTYEELPSLIRRIERRRYRGQEAIFTKELRFQNLKVGGVGATKVKQSWVELPDGIEVLPADKERKPLNWVIQDGKVVKSLDQDGERLARSAFFASTRRFSLIATTIVVAILACLVLYRRVSTS
jgi:hypothetical protein